MDELINCLFLQRTFLSNFPQSFSASEHNRHTSPVIRFSQPLLLCPLRVLCPHPHLTDSVRVCFTACVCERVTVCLVSGEETGSRCYVTGNGTGCTPPRQVIFRVSRLSWCPGLEGPGRGLTPTKHTSLCCDNSFKYIAACKQFKDGA